MFKSEITLESLRQMSKGTMVEHLGIEFLEIGNDYLTGRMPVNEKTIQPHGMLHGGASISLAETLGSVAATLTIDPGKKICLGLEINSNHIKGVREGHVIGRATPIHIGKTTQIWEIRITDKDNQLINISRLTLAIIDKKNEG